MTKFKLSEAARPNILSLLPYRCARDDFTEGILLDANENAYGSIGYSCEDNGLKLHRYPDPHQTQVKLKLLELRTDIKTVDNIFVGVGSDEVLDVIVRIFCRPGLDQVVVTPPTYGMYTVTAQINDVGILRSPLSPQSFQLNLPEIKQLIDAHLDTLKIIFLCSPGNPTGSCLAREDIEELLNYPYKGVVVVDEAYIDFADQPSTTNLVEKYNNLIIMQTLSKSFGLAGVRIGVGFAHPDIIRLMNNTKAPYNISSLSTHAALKALTPDSITAMRSTVQALNTSRSQLLSTFQSIPGLGTPLGYNQANFILLPILGHQSLQPSNSRALKVYQYLAEELKVVVRYRANEPNCQGCLRVTIGTPQENTYLVESLSKALKLFQSD